MADWDDAPSHQQATSGEGFRTPVQRLMKLATAEPGPFALLAEHAAGDGKH
jgi:hypothetical protein